MLYKINGILKGGKHPGLGKELEQSPVLPRVLNLVVMLGLVGSGDSKGNELSRGGYRASRTVE